MLKSAREPQSMLLDNRPGTAERYQGIASAMLNRQAREFGL